jgi:hypothetical protein
MKTTALRSETRFNSTRSLAARWLLAGLASTTLVATTHSADPAILDPKLSANIRLGDDPAALPADLRAQVGPHLARSYTDPGLLVATFQEGRYPGGGAAALGYAVSKDGGLTWKRALVPGLTTTTGGPWGRVTNPMAAIDRAGRLHLICELMPGSSPPTQVAINTSADLGETFSPPDLVFGRVGYNRSWLAINTFAASSTVDRLAALATGDMGTIQSSLSDDLGDSWSALSPASSANSFGCQPLFLPDGSLVNIYFRYLGAYEDLTSPAQVELMRSEDGGKTFGPPRTVTSEVRPGYHDPIARDAWDTPLACTDRQAGVLYVTYQALAGPASARPSILFARSRDKGVTWTTPVAVNDTPSDQGVFNPAIAVSPDGQHVTISFYDKRHQTADSQNNLVDLYLAESFDGGDTWEPNIRLSDVSSDLRLAPLTGDGRLLGDYQGIVPALNLLVPGVAVWIDTRTGNPDPFVVRISRTRGTTFQTWRRLRFSPAELGNPSLTGAEADPDADGIPCLMEYALGLEPGQVDGNPLGIVYTSSGSGSVRLSYRRLAVLSDVRFFWEASSDLREWQEIVPGDQPAVLDTDDPTLQRVSTRFHMGGSYRYFRLGVSL